MESNDNDTYNIINSVKDKIKEIREIKNNGRINHLDGIEDQINLQKLKSLVKLKSEDNLSLFNNSTLTTKTTTSNIEKKDFFLKLKESNYSSKTSNKGNSLLKADFLEDNNTENGDYSILKLKNRNSFFINNDKNKSEKNTPINDDSSTKSNKNIFSSSESGKNVVESNKTYLNNLKSNIKLNNNLDWNSNAKNNSNISMKRVDEIWNSNCEEYKKSSFNNKNTNHIHTVHQRTVLNERSNDSCLSLLTKNDKYQKSNLVNKAVEFLDKVKSEEKSFLNSKNYYTNSKDFNNEKNVRSKSEIKTNTSFSTKNNLYCVKTTNELLSNLDDKSKTIKKSEILDSINGFINYINSGKTINFKENNTKSSNSFRASATNLKSGKTMKEILKNIINNKSKEDTLLISSNLENIILSNENKYVSSEVAEQITSKNNNMINFNISSQSLTNNIWNNEKKLNSNKFSDKEYTYSVRPIIYQKNEKLCEKTSINMFKSTFEGIKNKNKIKNESRYSTYSEFSTKNGIYKC
jgi:hypothetical protein